MNEKLTILRTDAELNMGANWPAETRDRYNWITAGNDQPETIKKLAAKADLIFTCYAPITSDVIAASDQLKGIVKYGVGVDSIDIMAASQRGIPVAHCPHYGTTTVAEHAFSLMLNVARKISAIDAQMKAQGWLWPEEDFRGSDISGKTLGLIGFGRIGKAMARLASGFKMRILVSDPYVPHDTEGWTNLSFAPLEQVIKESDFLSLHTVLTPETKGIIGREELDRMKNSAVLINVSRGALIDQDALAAALKQQGIAGAGMDVFVKEPIPQNHPLYQLSNVVLTPHFAFYTLEAYQRLEQQCLEAVEAITNGELPRHVVNRTAIDASVQDRDSQNPADGSTKPSSDPTNLPAEIEDWQIEEGDTNLSSERTAWQQSHLSESTRQILQRDSDAFLHQSLLTPCLNVLERCQGSQIVDREGRPYFDFHGNSAHQVGYGHPHVVAAVKSQLETLPFCPRRFTNLPAIELAERLGQLAPGKLSKVLFAPGGTNAIGIALKLARLVTGRHKTISMWGSFHGASLDAISIGGESVFRNNMGPLMPGVFHVPWPHDRPDADVIEKIMKQEGDIAAVVVEPMRCTTIEHPTPDYWCRVRELCDQHGTLLIFDEIPTALGRTGRMFCCENFDVTPDILVIGKGLGGGIMPMAAIIADAGLDQAGRQALGHYTHEKSPLGSAAALATLDLIQAQGFLKQVRDLGDHAVQRLRKLQQREKTIADVRGLGLTIGVELADDKIPANQLAQRVLYRCLENGLSFKVSAGNVLTLTPPLTIEQAELDQALTILETVLAE